MQAYFVLVSPHWILIAASSMEIVIILLQDKSFACITKEAMSWFNLGYISTSPLDMNLEAQTCAFSMCSL